MIRPAILSAASHGIRPEATISANVRWHEVVVAGDELSLHLSFEDTTTVDRLIACLRDVRVSLAAPVALGGGHPPEAESPPASGDPQQREEAAA